LQELEETLYWLELTVEAGTFSSERLNDLISEADELTAILVTCAKNAKHKRDEK